MAADRRYGPPAKPNFLARKICQLETADSRGFLSYAGVGARVFSGEEPFELSEWISRSFRGPKFSLDEALEKLAVEATKRSFDALVRGHEFLYVGFLEKKPIIEFVTSGESGPVASTHPAAPPTVMRVGKQRFNRYRFIADPRNLLHASIGSGSAYLPKNMLSGLRRYMSVPRKYCAVEARLAHAIASASLIDVDRVSPECLVVSMTAGNTNRHREYSKSGSSQNCTMWIPTITNGLPLDEILAAIGPILTKHNIKNLHALKNGDDITEPDEAILNDIVKDIRDDPDSEFLGATVGKKPSGG